MRKIKTLLLVGLTFLFAAEGFAQRGIGTNLPEKSSVLELKSDTRGLLIPRVALTETTSQSPIVGDIANSLLVYNTATQNDVRPGYYYWDKDLGATGAWAALLSANSAGKNISITPDGTISIDPGADGQVLVTKLVDPNDPTSEVTSEWVDISEILGDLLDIQGTNGINVSLDNSGPTPIFTVELGGDLIKETIITTTTGNRIPNDPNEFDGTLKIESGNNKFFVSDLGAVTVNVDGTISSTTHSGADFTDTFDVLIVDDNGLVQKVKVVDLLKDAVEVANGLHYDIDGVIKLGGDLTKDTEIDLDEFDFTIKTGETTGDFKIEGLKETEAANKIMVVDETTNSVRTITRVISGVVNNSITIGTGWNSEYSPFVQEVNVTVPELTADIDLTLPAASANNEGQVINVRLTIGSESTNYLTIKDDGGTDLTYGALPHQGWVLKSNGTNWLIVSSN